MNRRAAVVACAIALLTGCAPEPGPTAGGERIRVLQLNLCNSGIAACHTGRATGEAAAAIRAAAPDVVTVNEACSGDLAPLRRALAATVPGAAGDAVVGAAFRAARDATTGEDYRCRNGERYGNAVLTRSPAVAAGDGVLPAQDPADPEQRTWLCLDTVSGRPLVACTSHLAYTDREVTLAQCRHLVGAVAADRDRRADGPVLVSGDLNLAAGDELDPCLPAGWTATGDGGRQHVLTGPGVAVDAVRLVDLRGATDHPGLLVEVVIPGPGRPGPPG